MKKAITYYRVSRPKQGKSGLGLEAQKQAVQQFVSKNDFLLTSEFVEVDSGKKTKRPMLLKALSACKKEQATLLIAALDRLARNVAFISALMEARVDFKVVTNPNASKLLLHLEAVIAEHERDQISARTIAALKVAKARGVELGKHGRDVLSVRNKRWADAFAEQLSPLITKLQRKGITTVRAITQELNRLRVPTYTQKGKWHVNTVHSVMKRLNHKT